MKAPLCKLCGEHHWALCVAAEKAVQAKPVIRTPMEGLFDRALGGRPRVHPSNAAKQKAYRERKKVGVT